MPGIMSEGANSENHQMTGRLSPLPGEHLHRGRPVSDISSTPSKRFGSILTKGFDPA